MALDFGRSWWRTLAAFALLKAFAGCGGGGSSTPHPLNDVCAASEPGDIVVTTTKVRDAADGACDLVEAVRAANTGRPVHGDCAVAGAVKRIVLAPGAIYPITQTLRFTATVTVGVCGGGTATISAAAGWTRPDQADSWGGCAVHVVSDSSVVELDGITLLSTPEAGLTGACATLGEVHLRRGRVTGFGAGGVVARCDPQAGCDHETRDQSATARIYNSQVDGNRSPSNGGGIDVEGPGASLVLEHSAVVGNTSDALGGGIYQGAGWSNQQIASSTISGNTGMRGGGMFVKFATCTDTYLYVYSTTIAFNTAVADGGGIAFEATPDSLCFRQDLNVISSIVTNNASMDALHANINSDWKGGHFTCSSSSLIYVAPGQPVPDALPPGAPCRFDVADAGLGPLLVMGGTASLPVHPLLAGSPAIDAAIDGPYLDQQRDGWIAGIDPPSPPQWSIFDRDVDGDGDGTAASDLGPYEVNFRWQAELLAVQAKGRAAHSVVTAPDGYDRGAGTIYAAAGAQGEFVTYVVPVAEAGAHALAVGLLNTSDGGRFQVAVAEDPLGPWIDVGPAQDSFASAPTFGEVAIGIGPAFVSPGQKYVRLTVVGKNERSSGYALHLDYLSMTKG